MTNIAAIGGTSIDAVETATAVPVSTTDTTGLAKPPVVVEEVNLPAALAPLIIVAVPPPAIMAKAQVVTGSKPATDDTIAAVPAIPAKGIATLSKRLSTQGIKYAKISTNMATPKVIKAGKLPIQAHSPLSSQKPEKAARLKAKRGKNTLNPAEAARPIPKKILIMDWGPMFIAIENTPFLFNKKIVLETY